VQLVLVPVDTMLEVVVLEQTVRKPMVAAVVAVMEL
jgi:hypothetical protein